MKSPAVQFYTGDFLSSPDVQVMEAHEVGAYCLLLFNAWQSDRPGFLANDEGRLRRLARLSAAQWAESRELLLSKFPVAADDETLRYNPRLASEAAKQLALREKNSANGSKGGRPPKYQTETKSKAKNNPPVFERNPTLLNQKPNESFSFSTSSSIPSDDGSAGEPSLAAEVEEGGEHAQSVDPAKAAAAATTDLDEEQHWREGPLSKPAAFRAICQRREFTGIDYEFYRRQALLDAENVENGAMRRTIRQWESWIAKYLERRRPLQPAPAEGAAPRPPVPRYGPAPTPTTTGYSLTARIAEQQAATYR